MSVSRTPDEPIRLAPHPFGNRSGSSGYLQGARVRRQIELFEPPDRARVVSVLEGVQAAWLVVDGAGPELSFDWFGRANAVMDIYVSAVLGGGRASRRSALASSASAYCTSIRKHLASQDAAAPPPRGRRGASRIATVRAR
jgi:hypothetical protein